eukprot:12527626-Heterocapsa_arctica.AAC.1
MAQRVATDPFDKVRASLAGQVRLRAAWNTVRAELDGQRASRLQAARKAEDERARAAVATAE